MQNTNIFCIISQTGGGKSLYLNKIFEDKNFVDLYDLSLLVYGTTRKMRPGEVDGKDYYYFSQEDYDKITDDELIESRSYYTMNDGEIYYFTKAEYFDKSNNVICITSPYQFESYRNWCEKQNIAYQGKKKYNLYLIIIHTDLKIRINRVMNGRASCEDDIYELCRRVIQEKNEFGDVSKRVPELMEPLQSPNVCYINNNSSNKSIIKDNLNKIKEFIKRCNEDDVYI